MPKLKVVALEEHFSHPALLAGMPMKPLGEALLDLGARRLREMDEAEIDLQVISHFPSGPQNLPPADAIKMSRATNDLIFETIDKYPDRFAGFASLPLTDPTGAERELERAVRELGFKGALLHGMAAGVPLDDRRFWGIYELAQALDVPIYIHPDAPPAGVADAYYKGHPALIGPGWSYTVESATQALRLMLSGVFDSYPRLKMILGHLGESLPFSIVRCDANLTRRANLKRPLKDYFHENFWITTSANLSNPALVCCMMEMGVERILFSVDWPFASNTENRRFIDAAPISASERTKILGSNAVELLKL
jgi:predicted TIM-barrel fold metal-dependent hydrolase